jgi:cytochrome c biogenesis protein CcdA
MSASATSANQALTTPQAAVSAMYIYNAGTTVMFFRFGLGAQTAVATDCMIAPGDRFAVQKGYADNVAVICPGGTGTFYVQPGEGQ